MTKKHYYLWEEFGEDAKTIARHIKKQKLRFDGVWGPPRGGLPLAVVLSHALDLPLLTKPKSKKTLIVDDIADTGKTLQPYAASNFIATLFYHSESTFEPNLWLRKKSRAWIVFPWEKNT